MQGEFACPGRVETWLEVKLVLVLPMLESRFGVTNKPISSMQFTPAPLTRAWVSHFATTGCRSTHLAFVTGRSPI
jgi:hypothetical protein